MIAASGFAPMGNLYERMPWRGFGESRGARYERMTVGRLVMRVSLFAIANALLLAAKHDVPQKRVPVLTVCRALQDRDLYSGQNVVIVGRLDSTGEGNWLFENCSLMVFVNGRSYPTSISTAYAESDFPPAPKKPRDFRWDERALQGALREVRKTTALEPSTRWFAVYGRLELKIPWGQRQVAGGTISRDGYGHLNSSSAQLVAEETAYVELK
jgi:hypothetical protein